MEFTDINFVAVGIGTLAAFLLGFVWYAPWLFGKAWQRHVGLSDDDLKGGNALMTFGPAIVLTFLIGLVLSAFMPAEIADWQSGALLGLILGLGLVATSFGINFLFSRRSVKLFMIDAGYQVLILVLFGALIAAMNGQALG